MTWQDELRRLDDDLAAGQLSAEDYRRRRDELIAQQPGDASDAGSPQQNTGQHAGGPTPFPPAFRWETTPPSETTQVVNLVGGDDASERTQVVSGGDGPTQAPEDSERTQVIEHPTGAPPSQRPEGPDSAAQGQPSPWGGQDIFAPPWTYSDRPPIQKPDSGWMMQGPEIFESGKKPGTGRIIGAVAAVVILLGIAVGSYSLFSRDEASTANPGTTTPAQQPGGSAPTVETEPQEPQDPLAPADLGGAEEEKNVNDFTDLETVGFLTDTELDALRDAGAAESRLLIANFEQGKATVLVSRTADPQQGMAARDELIELQLSFGFEPRAAAPPGVDSVELLNDDDVPPTVRAVYSAGDLVVRLEMTGENSSEVTAKFEEILEQQLQHMPSGV